MLDKYKLPWRCQEILISYSASLQLFAQKMPKMHNELVQGIHDQMVEYFPNYISNDSSCLLTKMKIENINNFCIIIEIISKSGLV